MLLMGKFHLKGGGREWKAGAGKGEGGRAAIGLGVKGRIG